MQFSQSSQERIGWNFCSRSLPIFVIWPNYGTCANSCDSVTTSFLAHSRVLPNSPALRGANRLKFSHATVSCICHFLQLAYLGNSVRSRESQSISMCASVRKFHGPPKSALVGIFVRDHFFSSSFGLIRALMRFCAIPRWSIFWHGAIFQIIPGAHRLEFLHAINSYLRHLAKLWYLGDFMLTRDCKFSDALACAT